MALKETTGHLLEIGDRVRMNIPFIKEEDMDGIEITDSGTNYWRYMCEHPDEIYTVEGFDYSNDEETSYILSGAMAGNNWYSNELILVPAPKTRFEAIKAMADRELAEYLAATFLPLFQGKAGLDMADELMRWLDGAPEPEMAVSPEKL